MIRIILLVGAGGFVGSVARYLVQLFFSRSFSIMFPLGTFTVNVVGSLLIGIIYGYAAREQALSEEWKFFLATGICGGFTTFSAFAFENFSLLRQGAYGVFFSYTLLSMVLSLGAVMLGIFISKT